MAASFRNVRIGVEVICKRMEKQEWDDDDWEKREWCGWVMDAGKKVVMTGIVISSAPVLLPPLLVVSALGFAMSLPSGVLLASYACTHKLMTKLLPLPLPYQQEEEEEEGEIKMGEGIKNGIEVRIELVDDDNNDVQVGRERELQEGREMSSSSENDVEEIQGNHDDNKTAVMVGDDTGEKLNYSLELKDLHSHEGEEKIWDKINAIRVIVGFKAPRRSSYVEEVKALYLFTGIEPQDQSHFEDLSFLMSVIGLK